MTRFYLRVLLLMLLTFVVSIVLILSGLGGLERFYFRPNFATEMQALARSLQDRLEGKSMAEARGELAKLENRLIFEMEVIPAPRVAQIVPTNAVFFRPEGAGYLLRLQPDEALIQNFQQKQAARLFIALTLSGIVTALAGLFVVWPLVRKLRLQEQTITRIAEGDLAAHAPEGSDALGKLGQRLNQMTARIRDLLGGQRELIHAVSHEMRTPTARLGFGLEMLAEADSEEDRGKRIVSMQDDLAEMDALLDELLAYLRFGQTEEPLSTGPLEVRRLLDDISRKAQPFAPAIRIDTAAVPPAASVVANAHHLGRALENLLRNAVRHAAAVVTVRFASEPEGTTIHIDDDGPGIPAADRQRIFEPFVRLDSSRDRKTGGTGLGLAIAHRIVARHGGTLTAGESPDGGARFTLAMPSRPAGR